MLKEEMSIIRSLHCFAYLQVYRNRIVVWHFTLNASYCFMLAERKERGVRSDVKLTTTH